MRKIKTINQLFHLTFNRLKEIMIICHMMRKQTINIHKRRLWTASVRRSSNSLEDMDTTGDFIAEINNKIII